MKALLCLALLASALGARQEPDADVRPGPSTFLRYSFEPPLQEQSATGAAEELARAVVGRLLGRDAPRRARVMRVEGDQIEVEVMGWDLDERELAWFQNRLCGTGRLEFWPLADPAQAESERALPLRLPERPEWVFGQADLGSIELVADERGAPALELRVHPDRAQAWMEFCAAHANQQVALVLDGRALATPQLTGTLGAEVRITGDFLGREEVVRAIEALSPTRLPARLTRVGRDERATALRLAPRSERALDADELERAREVLHQRLLEPGVPVYALPQVIQNELRLKVAARQLPSEERAWILGRSLARGAWRLRFEARDADLTGSSLSEERARLSSWLAAHPGAELSTFHALPRAQGGPHPRLRWSWPRGAQAQVGPLDASRALAGLEPAQEAWTFRGSDLSECFAETDFGGNPSLGGVIAEERRDDWAAYVAAHPEQRMLYVLDDVVLATQSFAGTTHGRLRMADELTQDEVVNAHRLWRCGELPSALRVVESAR